MVYKEHLKKFLDGKEVQEIKILQLLHFLQHYGVPTPLIDFTTDKDVALYFAYSGIAHELNIERKRWSAIPEYYVTIFELRTEKLITEEILQIAQDDTFDKWEKLMHGDFYLYKPKENLGNKNIVLQKGLFLCLDSSMTVEAYVDQQFYQSYPSINLTTQNLRHAIVKHRIPYFSFFKQGKCTTGIFPYLLKNNKLGKDLFDDIKGIQFDVNNPGIRLGCITNPEDCECLYPSVQPVV